MEILSWNIQAAKGVDEVVSVERIATDIRQFSDPDVICVQEVLRTPGNDQVEQLADQFPGYMPIYGPATDRIHRAGRLQFGNMILSRIPVLQISQHKLPQPCEPDQKHIPRQATEILVDYHDQTLRIITTHLEYFAQKQRSEQIEYLAKHHQDSHARFTCPSPNAGEDQFKPIPETTHCVYCGDFNMTTDSADFHKLTEKNAIGCQLLDCWSVVHGNTPHAPTCGIFDNVQWTEGPHCRDYFFASASVVSKVKSMSVQTQTASSDHQPLKIILQ